MPAVGLGYWKVPPAQAPSLTVDAIGAGYRHLDCASDYGNEPGVGQGITEALSKGLCSRDDLWVTSKLWNTYHRPEHVHLLLAVIQAEPQPLAGVDLESALQDQVLAGDLVVAGGDVIAMGRRDFGREAAALDPAVDHALRPQLADGLIELLDLSIGLHVDLVEPEQIRLVVREEFLDLRLGKGGDVAVEILPLGIGIIPDIVLFVMVAY